MAENPDELKDKIRRRFVMVALDPKAPQRHPTGPDSARRLGYDPATIDGLPAAVTESFAGVGNPLALGDPCPGETVLDLGCGAGVDSILAARRVGPTGRVVGVDMTAEMVEKARINAAAAGVANSPQRIDRSRPGAGRRPGRPERSAPDPCRTSGTVGRRGP